MPPERPDLQAVPIVALQAGAKKVLITAPAKVRPAPLHHSSSEQFLTDMWCFQLPPPASTLGIPAVASLL